MSEMADAVVALLLASLGLLLACALCATPVTMMLSAAKLAVWTCVCACAVALVLGRIENKPAR